MRSRLSTTARRRGRRLLLEDVAGAEFGRIKAATDAGVPTFSLRNVKEFSVYRSKPVKETETC